MKNIKTLLSTLFLVSIFHFSYASDKDAVIADLIGLWNWESSYGGFAGWTVTPEDAGYSVKLMLYQTEEDVSAELLSYVLYRNDSVNQTGTTSLTLMPTIYALEELWSLDINPGITGPPFYYSSILHLGDSLIIGDNYSDGYLSTFIKSALPDPAVACQAIDRFEVLHPNGTKAQLHYTFEPFSYPFLYRIQGRPVGTEAFASLTFYGESPKIISGLNPGTCYEWRIRARCETEGPAITGPYSGLQTFCTSVPKKLSVEENKLSIFPNPATDLVYLQYQASANTPLEVRIMDISGVVIYRMINGDTTGRNYIPLDITTLSTGMYFVEVLEGENSEIVKLQVVN